MSDNYELLKNSLEDLIKKNNNIFKNKYLVPSKYSVIIKDGCEVLNSRIVDVNTLFSFGVASEFDINKSIVNHTIDTTYLDLNIYINYISGLNIKFESIKNFASNFCSIDLNANDIFILKFEESLLKSISIVFVVEQNGLSLSSRHEYCIYNKNIIDTIGSEKYIYFSEFDYLSRYYNLNNFIEKENIYNALEKYIENKDEYIKLIEMVEF